MKARKILAFALALCILAPGFSIARALSPTVSLAEGQTLEQALLGIGISAGDSVHVLTITGEITEADTDFIRDNLTVTSLNLIGARFYGDKVPDGAFSNYGSLRSIALPLGTVAIGDGAFENAHSLSSVGMGPALAEIGARAFAGCGSLETVVLSENISAIGSGAFAHSGLTAVIAMRDHGGGYNAAANAFTGVRAQLVVPAGAIGYDAPPFSELRRVEWVFHRFPESIHVLAGTSIELSADVTDIASRQAEYQWYHNGFPLHGMTGDTLVISDISREAAGRYGVLVTLGGVSVMFTSIVEVTDLGGGGWTTYSTRNIAPDRSYIAEPEPEPEPEPEYVAEAVLEEYAGERAEPRQVYFNDIGGHWGELEILSAAALDIVAGYPDGSFRPDGEVTRAEFTAMLMRVIYPATDEISEARDFDEAQGDDWFYEYVRAAGATGLLGFVQDGRFYPEQAITREEAAYMVAAAYAGLTGAADASPVDYRDLGEIGGQFLDAVNICTNAGLMQGAFGYFMPQDALTRAEAAAVLDRLFNALAAAA